MWRAPTLDSYSSYSSVGFELHSNEAYFKISLEYFQAALGQYIVARTACSFTARSVFQDE